MVELVRWMHRKIIYVLSKKKDKRKQVATGWCCNQSYAEGTFQERLDLAADGVSHPVVRDALHVLQLVFVGYHGVAPVGDQVHNLVPPCREK